MLSHNGEISELNLLNSSTGQRLVQNSLENSLWFHTITSDQC